MRLTLVAPHFEAALLPTLLGRLVRAVPGYFGLLRYVVELDEPLALGFDPLGELPWFSRARRVRYLLVTPAPDAPTLEAPPDVIGETIEEGRIVHVFVSIGPSDRALRAHGDEAADEPRCPFLCMADLEGVPIG